MRSKSKEEEEHVIRIFTTQEFWLFTIWHQNCVLYIFSSQKNQVGTNSQILVIFILQIDCARIHLTFSPLEGRKKGQNSQTVPSSKIPSWWPVCNLVVAWWSTYVILSLVYQRYVSLYVMKLMILHYAQTACNVSLHLMKLFVRNSLLSLHFCNGYAFRVIIEMRQFLVEATMFYLNSKIIGNFTKLIKSSQWHLKPYNA